MSRGFAPPFQLLELNLISAQDLAKVSRKMKTYAVAWIHPDRKLSTRVDIPGHNNPTWNDKFVFRVDDDFLYGETSAIMIEIYALHWFRDVHVGTVRVIVGNLIPLPKSTASTSSTTFNLAHASLPFRYVVALDDRRPELRRTKSDTSSMVGSDVVDKKTLNKKKAGSMVNGSAYEKQNSKASSMITDSDIFKIGKKGKSDSTSSGTVYGALTNAKYGSNITGGDNNKARNKNLSSNDDSSVSKFNRFDLGKLQFGTPKKMNLHGGGPLITESELGPSASEVAAAVARKKNRYVVEETESEIMGSWSLESSMEGLQSKLERWRTELPPVYDLSDLSSCNGSVVAGGRGAYRHKRRSSDSDGVFSCFGTICGVECSIVCGGSPRGNNPGG
ncbi:hypothetical protein GH714_021824 [Hevea brasiliensis]|uniref:C2 domain-containing protein n=1 Tax=Hevea brasiliensis TaxID=3981 RepID=A0A6A6MP36_HEVBR|nr:hypothetical protein GH714_021824 [Hevea brasiliensis]